MKCHIGFLKTKPIAGFCPVFGECHGLTTGETYTTAGFAKFKRCDICLIRCEYFTDFGTPAGAGQPTPWGVKCDWAW